MNLYKKRHEIERTKKTADNKQQIKKQRTENCAEQKTDSIIRTEYSKIIELNLLLMLHNLRLLIIILSHLKI